MALPICPGCTVEIASGSRTVQHFEGPWHEPCSADRIAGRTPGVTRAGLQQALDDLVAADPPADPGLATLRTSLITGLTEALR